MTISSLTVTRQNFISTLVFMPTFEEAVRGCICLGPYNYPLNETFALLIPALIMEIPPFLNPQNWGFFANPLWRPFKIASQGCGQYPFWRENARFTTYGNGKIDVLALLDTAIRPMHSKCHPKKNRLRIVLGLRPKTQLLSSRCRFGFSRQECIAGTFPSMGSVVQR